MTESREREEKGGEGRREEDEEGGWGRREES
jgi:hypothetical protein